MPREFKSAISHLALCFSSLYGLERTAGGYMGFTFGVMTLHSVIGVIYYIQTEDSENFHKIYRGSRIPIYALSLAPLAAHALSTAGNSAFSIFPMILGVVPSILYIADRAYDETQYAVILANAVSCGFLSFFNQCGGKNFTKMYKSSRLPIYALFISPLASYELVSDGYDEVLAIATVLGMISFILYIANRKDEKTQHGIFEQLIE